MSGEGLRVLLVMQESSTREHLLTELTKRGFPIAIAVTNYTQARAQLLTSGDYYHALLLDDCLASAEAPEYLFEFINLVKQSCPGTEVILFSKDIRQHVIPALQAGASFYLLKPLDAAEVAALLHQIDQRIQFRRGGKYKQLLTELLATDSPLGSGNNEQETLECVLSGIRHIGFDRVRLYLFTGDRKYLFGKAQVGMKGNDFVGVSWPVTDDEYLQELMTDPRPRVFECEPGKPTHPEDRLDKQGLKEWLCVPLVRNKGVIGLISADNKYCRRPIVEQEMAPLALFATQAAAAIDNARLTAQKEEKLACLAEVSRATTEIFGNLGRNSLPEMLQLIARRGAEILAAETCSILLVNRHGILTLEAGYGHSEGSFLQGREFAIRTGRGGEQTGHIDTSGKCDSLLAIPLTRHGHEDQPIGWLRVENKKNREGAPDPTHYFTAEDEFILRIFAEAIGASIECARWLDELRREKKEKELVIESMPLAVISIDTRGTVLTFNRQAEKIFGFSQNEALGAKVHRLYEDQLEPRQIGELLDRNNGKLTDYMTNIRSSSGQVIPIRMAARWMHDERGNLIGSVGFFENLLSLYQTQKRLELILKASNVLAQAQNLVEGLQSLAEMMVSLFPNAFCRILLYDEGDATLTVQASYPLAQSGQFGWTWEPGIGSIVSVSDYAGLALLLQKGQPDVIKFSNDKQQANLQRLSNRLALEQPVQSLLLIPLLREDKLVGLLYLGELCSEQQSQFTPENITLVSAIAAQTTVLIEHRRLLEMAERRKSLLSELATVLEHITAEQDVHRLRQGLSRGLAQLTGCDAGGLALYRPRLRQLEVKATFGLDGLTVGQRVCADMGLLSQIAQTGKTEIRRGDGRIVADDELLATQNFKTVIAVPLKKSSGEVEAVLFAGDRTGQCQFTVNDLGILERFATNAALALQNASLIKSEQKRRDHLSLLDQIHKFIQEAKDKDKVLDAILTAITLGYGLQLNRALVLLLDDTRRNLIGAAGIGQLDEDEAYDVWEKQRYLELPDFAKYLDELKGSGITLTTVGSMARDLRFTLGEDAADTQLFAGVLQKHECKRIPPEQFSKLPPDLLEKFKPTSELVIVPLVTKNQGIGVLIVDNKFNRSPIEESDIKLLISFANTAAVAIDNIELLNSFYAFSNNLSSYQSLDELREAIGQAMWLATGASWVGLVLIDEQGDATAPLTYPKDYFSAALAMPRLNGISMSVLKTGQARTFPYTDKEREKLHPEFPPTIKAAACLPLCLPDKRIGVMWLDYEQPHHFTEFELGVLQLFVNHVANAYEAAQRIERFEKRRVAYESLALCNGSREVIKQIMESARHFLRANYAVFWFYDDKGGEFLIGNSEASGISEADWRNHQKNVPSRGGTAHQALKQPYLLLRDAEDQRQRQPIGNRTLQLIADLGGRGLLGLPLKVGKESLGILYLIYQHNISYGKEWLETALAFANHAALSLKNAQLLEQLTRTNEAARTVATVTKLGEIRKTLDEIVREVHQTTQCDAVVLFEYDQQSGEFTPHRLMPGAWYPERVLSLAEGSDHWLIERIILSNEPTVVVDVSANLEIGRTRFALDEESKSFLAVPLIAIDQKLGVLFVNYRRPHRFATDELEIISLLADQAAVALRIAHLIAERERKQEYLRLLLHEASRAIAASFGPDIEQVLDQLLNQAVKSLSAIKPSGRLIGTIQRYNPETNELTVKNIYPPETRQHLLEKVGETWSLDKNKNKLHRIGVTGRTILEKSSQLIPNVHENPDYQIYNLETRSELSVPLLNKDRIPIGVINIESEQINGFDKEDQEMLERLAEITVVVLENEERYRQYQEYQMRQAVKASNDLAFMSIASTTWWHAVGTHAQTIKETAQFLRDEIKSADLLKVLEPKIQRIEEVSNELLDKHKMTMPLSNHQGVQRQALFPLLCDRIRRLCEQQNQPVEFLVAPTANKKAAVKINAHWLNRAIDILVNNAIESMAQVERKELRLAIKRQNNKVMIELSDTGTGIPEQVRAKLFKERIEKPPTARGLGIGLLMARTIIQAYGGDIYVVTTGEAGTTMCFWLPSS